MKAAVWLESDPDRTVLLHASGARRLPGAMMRKGFGGCAVAQPTCSAAWGLSTGWARPMGDDALHLYDCEALPVTSTS